MGVRLKVVNAGEQEQSELVYEFEQDLVRIGRGPAADVRLPDPTVSALHAAIRLRGSRYVLIDEGSTNGTWVGGSRLPVGRPHPLSDGEEIQVGIFRIRFDGAVAVAEPTAVDRTGALARVLVRRVLSGEEDLQPPRLLLLNGSRAGESIELPPPPARLVVGRATDCDIVLDDADASRRHCELLVRLESVQVVDLGSKNGTFVGERRVEQASLRHGDQVTVGATILLFEDPAAERLDAISEAEDVPLPEPPRLSAAPEPPPPDAAQGGEGADPRAADGAPAPSDARGEPTEEVEAAPEESATPPAVSRVDLTDPGERPSARRLSGELLVYLLAATMLLVSVAGLVVLFGLD